MVTAILFQNQIHLNSSPQTQKSSKNLKAQLNTLARSKIQGLFIDAARNNWRDVSEPMFPINKHNLKNTLKNVDWCNLTAQNYNYGN